MSRSLWIILLALASCPETRAQESFGAPRPEIVQQRVERRLQSPVSVDFRGTPFRQAIGDLSEVLYLPIVLADAIAEEDISIERPIALKLEGITARSVLHLLVRQVHLAWVIKDGKVWITTEREARRTLVWRTYPVEAVLVTEADWVDERSSEWLMSILSTVAPGSWLEHGGKGSIVFHADARELVVHQTPEVHEQVQDVIDALQLQQDR